MSNGCITQAVLNTQPAGGVVLVDGVARTTPYTFTRVAEYPATVEVIPVQSFSNWPQAFDHWQSGKPGDSRSTSAAGLVRYCDFWPSASGVAVLDADHRSPLSHVLATR